MQEATLGIRGLKDVPAGASKTTAIELIMGMGNGR